MLAIFFKKLVTPTKIQKINVNCFASFKEKMEQRQRTQSNEEFKKEIEFMANKPTFTLADYKQRIVDGLAKMKSGLRYKFMAGNEQNEQQMTQQKKILNALYEEEMLDKLTLKGDQKKQISAVTNVPVSEINQLLKNFDQLEAMHSWLRKCKERGESLPENQDDLLYRFRRDRPVASSYVKLKMRRPRMSKRQLRQRIKWGWNPNN